MAANSNAVRRFVSSQMKRFANQAPSTGHSPNPFSGFRRNKHTSVVYDKNVDEHVRPALVPDYMIQQKSEYWAPHPHTGVFGPASGPGSISGAHITAAMTVGGLEPSVLEQKAFFRTMENLDKPHHP